jgi:hypothetical protein
VCPSAPWISHLLFADDYLVFLRADQYCLVFALMPVLFPVQLKG